MSYTHDIRFLVQKRRSNGYSSTTVYKRIKWNKFEDRLVDDSIDTTDGILTLFMSTKISRGWFRSNWHVMALDCDAFADMQMAGRTLKEDDISHIVIESTPGKYWILANKVGKFQDVYRYARSVPGVDRQYLRFTRDNREFHLRAYPKRGYIPVVRGQWVSHRDRLNGSAYEDMFSYNGNRSKWRKWLRNWGNYWDSSPVRIASRSIEDGIRTGRIPPLRDDFGYTITPPEEIGDLYMTSYDSWAVKEGNEEPVEELPAEADPVLEINNCVDLLEL